jgi:S-adenosylmethionine decarboxylase
MAVFMPPVLYSADLKGCNHLQALSPEHVTDVFAWTLEEAGATVVGSLSHHFPETGLTTVLILTESHAVVHTWPETGTIHLDIFSCSTRLRSLAAIANFGEAMGAANMSVQEVPRADGHRPVHASRP